MTQPKAALDCVAFMLIANNAILVEKRSMTKQLLPGALAIPGGHVDEEESVEDALLRELREELDIMPRGFTYVCTLIHQAEELRRIHYFVVEAWSGEMRALEADSLRWLSLSDLAALDLEIDRQAIESFLVQTMQVSLEYRFPPVPQILYVFSLSLWLFFSVLSLITYLQHGRGDAFVTLFFLLLSLVSLYLFSTYPRWVRLEPDSLIVQNWWWKSELPYAEIVAVRVTLWGVLVCTAKSRVHLPKLDADFCSEIYEQLIQRVPVVQALHQQRFAALPIVIHTRRASVIVLFLFALCLVVVGIAALNHAFTADIDRSNRWGAGIFGVVILAVGAWICYGIPTRSIWRYIFTATSVQAHYTLRNREWQAADIRAINVVTKEQFYPGQSRLCFQVEIRFANGEILPVSLSQPHIVIGDRDVGEVSLIHQLAERLRSFYFQTLSHTNITTPTI